MFDTDATSHKYTIVWEKWKDPLGFDDQEDDQLDQNQNPEYNDTYEDRDPLKAKKIKCQLLHTPFGIIPINENTASSEIFNFWTGHTNFAITKVISDIIESTDGVETLNVFTKYRFRIAVGKAFNDSSVMRTINKNIYSHLNNTYVAN